MLASQLSFLHHYSQGLDLQIVINARPKNQKTKS